MNNPTRSPPYPSRSFCWYSRFHSVLLNGLTWERNSSPRLIPPACGSGGSGLAAWLMKKIITADLEALKNLDPRHGQCDRGQHYA